MKKKILAIIPARMASSRFPGKPMALIKNLPMIGHCYLRSRLSKLLTKLYVATPDKEIYNYILSIGGKAIMTSHKHIMCNDRVFEAVDKIEHKLKSKNQIIVNIQGDLPIIYPDMIDSLIMPLIKNKNIPIFNCDNLSFLRSSRNFKCSNLILFNNSPSFCILFSIFSHNLICFCNSK